MLFLSQILNSISEDEFKNKIKVRFNNILDGFDKYSNGLLEYNGDNESFQIKEECFINFFNEALELNKGKVIIDLYIKDLENESLARLLEGLDERDKNILIDINKQEIKSVYFELDNKDLMSFITRLNTRELFFCTIYFMKKPMTIWGNYNLSFPMFFEENNMLEIYIDLAKKHNLDVRGIVLK
ncbi:hypothetical protein P5E48_03730 [Clostridium perfringens]|nr:hypothetical protein [Clostridium perfringens]MDK0735168.1 hypothetical protein [Clostridium perfringens]MDK0792347.1 hypothetical protein [Clostridium perfringens]